MAEAADRAQWGSSLEFILTVIGYAVGLGNVWRFPFLVFKHGGAPFLIPFFIMLFLVGIPTFFLETSLGQFTAMSPTNAFENLLPIFKGLGYAAIIINAFIGFYYNTIIAYCFYYFFFSIRAKLPWTDCAGQLDCYKRQNFTEGINCTLEKIDYLNSNNLPLNYTLRSPSELFFYEDVLKISNGIQYIGDIQYPLALCLLLSWFLVFAALSKGVASLGKVSYFTATFPYVMLTILVVKGATLKGADLGVKYYVGSFDASKLGDPELWKDATVQVFYALSACSGGLVSMSSFSSFKNNLVRDSLLVPILDCLTGFYAGFAIFTVLGNMYLTKCANDFSEVAAQGPELAFVVYPEGLSLMGKAAPLFSVLFFIMMLALGFGSEFSIMESAMSTFIDTFKRYINTKFRIIVTRAGICIVYFLLGLTMTTEGGLFILNLIDSVVAGYPLLTVGLLQTIAIPWVYGTKKFSQDIEQMIGKKSELFWWIWVIAWRFLCPIALIVIIIATIVIPAAPLSLRGKVYPTYAVIIGWLIVALPVLATPVTAIVQIIIHKADWRYLLNPTEEYYANSRKQAALEREKENEEVKMDEIRSVSGKSGRGGDDDNNSNNGGNYYAKNVENEENETRKKSLSRPASHRSTNVVTPL